MSPAEGEQVGLSVEERHAFFQTLFYKVLDQGESVHLPPSWLLPVVRDALMHAPPPVSF